MAIDTTGPWWKGDSSDDLAEYLRVFSNGWFPVTEIVRGVCSCGGTGFELDADDDQGVCRRTCTACRGEHLVCDSAQHWAEAAPERVICPCGGEVYDVAAGFAFRASGDVRWIAVGARCQQCGVLGSCASWVVAYAPTPALQTMV